MIWTETELAYLKENAALGREAIAQHLNKTLSQVTNKAYLERISLARLKTGRKLNPNLVVDQHKHRKGIKSVKVTVSPFSPELLKAYPNAIKSNMRLWCKRRAIILKMHDYICYYCGDTADTVDHIKDRHLGGTDEINNLVAACRECNFGKVNKIKYFNQRKMRA